MVSVFSALHNPLLYHNYSKGICLDIYNQIKVGFTHLSYLWSLSLANLSAPALTSSSQTFFLSASLSIRAAVVAGLTTGSGFFSFRSTTLSYLVGQLMIPSAELLSFGNDSTISVSPTEMTPPHDLLRNTGTTDKK